MKLFIDTNILLGMYRMSGPDLDELRKLVALVRDGKVDLLVSQQVVDEFWRNREAVISDALKRFQDSRPNVSVPNIILSYEESDDLTKAIRELKDIMKDLLAKARGDVESGELKADKIIGQLLDLAAIGPISDETLIAAQRRMDIGNPPGKKGSLGDAISWEWLLHQEFDEEITEVVVLSGDIDFESNLVAGRMKEFLSVEWSRLHPKCALRLERSLAEWLEKDFPDIKLVDETEKKAAIEELETGWLSSAPAWSGLRPVFQAVGDVEERQEAIESLEQSYNFMATHRAVSALSRYEDFNAEEVERLLEAYLRNEQIHWILGDDDVRDFACRLIQKATSEDGIALANDLRQMLLETEPDDDSDDS